MVSLLYCAKRGGARTGRTGGLVKSCEITCGGNAAKDRLKRLSEGKHPYKTYKDPIQLLGPLVGDWASRERPPPAITGEGVGLCADFTVDPDPRGPRMVLGQELTARAQAELLALLRLNEEALELHLAGDLVGFAGLSGDADEEDPFGFDGGSFDS